MSSIRNNAAMLASNCLACARDHRAKMRVWRIATGMSGISGLGCMFVGLSMSSVEIGVGGTGAMFVSSLISNMNCRGHLRASISYMDLKYKAERFSNSTEISGSNPKKEFGMGEEIYKAKLKLDLKAPYNERIFGTHQVDDVFF